ncbi:spore gernimation protein GerQ [Bacillus sp. FJAT-27225]|uniref:spore coat protein n=1 Tax=Bacillus sp. FJAT-27225 TaxID=1743144 RepID=UPI00080C2EE0|nr:spore coat protein [Bacillus sp. FJAT-27225]OCA90664.1 spore gernimation protein GerQ [Bacillus sp. FJAT-27225]
MNQDFLDPKYAEGMPKMADASFAMDFLLSVKNGIRNYGFAITEAATPELKHAMERQMMEAIDLHEKLVNLMIKKGWLYPHDPGKQIELDIKSMDMALAIADMKLFPNDTDRLGTFATPNY